MIANLNAEKAILHIMIFEGEEYYTRALASLRPEDFAELRHGTLFAACVRCASKGELNRITVENYTQDAETLRSLEWAPSSQLDSYIEAVQDCARRRAYVAKAREAIDAAECNGPDYAALAQDALTAAQAGSGIAEPVKGKALEDILSLYDERKAVLKSGFPELDGLTRGLNKRELIVIAAGTSMGKTSLAMNIALNVARKGVPVAVFSLETDIKTLLRRAVCSISGVTDSRLMLEQKRAEEGRVAEFTDAQKAVDVAMEIDNMPLYIKDRTGITPEEIITECYKVKRSAGSLGLVVIDYLQLITGRQAKNNTRERDVAEMSRKMKILAGQLDVPVIILSQFSRDIDKRTDKTPQLSDLRESGAIEQDADIVLLIAAVQDKPEADGAIEREIIIAKNRNGKKGKITLMWRGDIFRFYNPRDYREVDEKTPFEAAN